jgi:hypothetical protein
VTGTTAWDNGTRTLTFTPGTALTPSTQYAVAITGIKDAAGNTTPTVTWSFTTGDEATIFGTAVPNASVSTDTRSTEVGVKFTVSVNGYVTAIRFYKGAGNTGTHVGRLWLGTTLMASAVFEGETATGWQTVQLSEPVPITTGRTYTVTYYAPAGRFSTTPNYFSSAKTSNPFTATTGVFRRGTGGVLPTSTTTTNYWVDATFSTKVPSAQTLFATGVPATQSGTDTRSVETGTRFTTSSAGSVTAVRFFKGAANTGVHVGRLWTNSGTLLGTVTFTNESASGWQTAVFPTAIPLQAGETYVVTYLAPVGRTASTSGMLSPAWVSGSLTATQSVLRYGTGGVFPTTTSTTNRWVDVVFTKS